MSLLLKLVQMSLRPERKLLGCHLTIFSRLAQASGASSALSLAALSSSAFRCALRAT